MCFSTSSNKMALASLAVSGMEAVINGGAFGVINYLISKLRIMAKKNGKDMT